MKLAKAIENLKEIQTDLSGQLDADDLVSIQLGIEALKAIELERSHSFVIITTRLPGETEA